ncbi:GntR family transcriptional regulator [Streptomyces caatingaensis]|uniref:GntR family transcriptional regulator n=1 Tax=Streptomyces caatingaensis TaxID=1678637 RepID=A0A0K9XHP3_9ACTN|nr:GntR family transcriptional regulator [Streptomyces caatingaensis]KNB52793.1 GntR family transcriptional regulator [Streptomyces caatingaensis]
MLITIDRSSATPLSEQIAAALRRAMVEGSLRMGDRLPPARGLARDLGVNMHTVLRGYQALQDEGIVELRRGRGAVVVATAPGSRALLMETGRRFVALARESGLSDAEIVDLLRGRLVSG